MVSDDEDRDDLARALYIAAAHDQTEIVQHLLGLPGSDPTAPLCAQKRSTPLHIAAHKGAEGALRLLVAACAERGVGVDVERRNGQTPLSVALQQGQTSAVRVLLDGGADPNAVAAFEHAGCGRAPLLSIATWYGIMHDGDAGPLRELLAAPSLHGVDHLRASFRDGARTKGRYSARKAAAGGTPLVCAAAFGWLEGVRLLTERELPPQDASSARSSGSSQWVHKGYHTDLDIYARQRPLSEERRREVLELAFASPWFRADETAARMAELVDLLQACWFLERSDFSCFKLAHAQPSTLIVFCMWPEPWWGLDWLLQQDGVSQMVRWHGKCRRFRFAFQRSMPFLQWAVARHGYGLRAPPIAEEVLLHVWRSGVFPPLSGLAFLAEVTLHALWMDDGVPEPVVERLLSSGMVLPLRLQELYDVMEVALRIFDPHSHRAEDSELPGLLGYFSLTHPFPKPSVLLRAGDVDWYFRLLDDELATVLRLIPLDGGCPLERPAAVGDADQEAFRERLPKSLALLPRKARLQRRLEWLRLLRSPLPRGPAAVVWLSAAAPRAVVRLVLEFCDVDVESSSIA